MWDPLQGKVYTNKPRFTGNLKGSIHQEIAVITTDTLQCVLVNLVHRVQLCMDARGDHIQHRKDGTQFHKDKGMHVHLTTIGAQTVAFLLKVRESRCILWLLTGSSLRCLQIIPDTEHNILAHPCIKCSFSGVPCHISTRVFHFEAA